MQRCSIWLLMALLLWAGEGWGQCDDCPAINNNNSNIGQIAGLRVSTDGSNFDAGPFTTCIDNANNLTLRVRHRQSSDFDFDIYIFEADSQPTLTALNANPTNFAGNLLVNNESATGTGPGGANVDVLVDLPAQSQIAIAAGDYVLLYVVDSACASTMTGGDACDPDEGDDLELTFTASDFTVSATPPAANTICPGDDFDITYTIAPAPSVPYSIDFENADGSTGIATGLTGGQFTITYTADLAGGTGNYQLTGITPTSGCTGTLSGDLVLAVDLADQPPATGVSLTLDNVTPCQNEAIEATVSIPGNFVGDYIVDFSVRNPNTGFALFDDNPTVTATNGDLVFLFVPSGVSAGFYRVTVDLITSDPQGCASDPITGTFSFLFILQGDPGTVPAGLNLTGPGTAICAGDSAIVNVAGLTVGNQYELQFQAGSSVVSQTFTFPGGSFPLNLGPINTTTSFQPLGLRNLTLGDECPGDLSGEPLITITVNPRLDDSTLAITADSALCAGEQLQVCIDGPLIVNNRGYLIRYTVTGNPFVQTATTTSAPTGNTLCFNTVPVQAAAGGLDVAARVYQILSIEDQVTGCETDGISGLFQLVTVNPVPPPTLFEPIPISGNVCAGSPAEVQLSGAGLNPQGEYALIYSRAGNPVRLITRADTGTLRAEILSGTTTNGLQGTQAFTVYGVYLTDSTCAFESTPPTPVDFTINPRPNIPQFNSTVRVCAGEVLRIPIRNLEAGRDYRVNYEFEGVSQSVAATLPLGRDTLFVPIDTTALLTPGNYALSLTTIEFDGLGEASCPRTLQNADLSLSVDSLPPLAADLTLDLADTICFSSNPVLALQGLNGTAFRLFYRIGGTSRQIGPLTPPYEVSIGELTATQTLRIDSLRNQQGCIRPYGLQLQEVITVRPELTGFTLIGDTVCQLEDLSIQIAGPNLPNDPYQIRYASGSPDLGTDSLTFIPQTTRTLAIPAVDNVGDFAIALTEAAFSQGLPCPVSQNLGVAPFRVQAKPQAAFRLDGQCLYDAFDITDQTTANAPLDRYVWFVNGSPTPYDTSSSPPPYFIANRSEIASQDDSMQVRLIATTVEGCADTLLRRRVVNTDVPDSAEVDVIVRRDPNDDNRRQPGALAVALDNTPEDIVNGRAISYTWLVGNNVFTRNSNPDKVFGTSGEAVYLTEAELSELRLDGTSVQVRTQFEGAPCNVRSARLGRTQVADLPPLPPTLRLFPNPNRGTFRVEMIGTTAQQAQVQVLDRLGRLAHAEAWTWEQPVLQRKLSLPLTPGLYTLRLLLPDGTTLHHALSIQP